MNQSDITALCAKHHDEGRKKGKAEGAAMVRASTILAIKYLLGEESGAELEASLLGFVDFLGGRNGAGCYLPGGYSEACELAERLLGRPSTASASTPSGMSQVEQAEAYLKAAGITGAPSSGDLGDQVLELMLRGRASPSVPATSGARDLGDQVVALLERDRAQRVAP